MAHRTRVSRNSGDFLRDRQRRRVAADRAAAARLRARARQNFAIDKAERKREKLISQQVKDWATERKRDALENARWGERGTTVKRFGTGKLRFRKDGTVIIRGKQILPPIFFQIPQAIPGVYNPFGDRSSSTRRATVRNKFTAFSTRRARKSRRRS